ncbi:MAG: transcriptional repressor [Acetatifactor sp.]|nr:transcriptional repressor [Acetatifactor sp.]
MKKQERKIGVYDLNHTEIEYPEGIKWTRQRKAVYAVLWNATEPMSAVRIYHLVEQESDGEEYAPSTIYRILSAFEEKGLIEKEADMVDGTITYELCRGSHKHYAVCLECKRRIPLQNCPFAHIHLDRETEDFTIIDHKLEVYGYCKDCREVKSAEK